MLVNGQWTKHWDPYQHTSDKGEFVRQTSSFRSWVTTDGSAGATGSAGFKAEPGRYHLYVAYICPWASRTLMLLKLKGLEDVISVSVVEPRLSEEGWRFGHFPGASTDALYGARHLHELYTRADSHVSGRATVPVLWDKKTHTIVNNESADILLMLNQAFEAWATQKINLRPDDLIDEIDSLNASLYQQLNNGVYRAGFAKSQEAYESAVVDVFTMLNTLEHRLKNRRYLFGERLTESDVRLFVTLIRFDAAYYGLFKCNLKRIAEYRHLSSYMERIYTLPGIAETVRLDHIKTGYYSVKALNPNGIVPLGPRFTFIR